MPAVSEQCHQDLGLFAGLVILVPCAGVPIAEDDLHGVCFADLLCVARRLELLA